MGGSPLTLEQRQMVFRLRPTDGSVATWQMPEMIGWLIERANSDGFVARMQRDIVYLGLEPLSITPIARPEPVCRLIRPFFQAFRSTNTTSFQRSGIWMLLFPMTLHVQPLAVRVARS